MNYEERGSYGYLLTGIILGIVLGLVVAWYLSPVERIDTHPATLQANLKITYRELIAAAFSANGDVGRAIARLVLIGDQNSLAAISSQAQLSSAGSGSNDTARELGLLAAALSDVSVANPQQSATVTSSVEIGGTDLTATVVAESTNFGVTPEINQTENPTATTIPTVTPTATGGAPYAVEIFSEICDPRQPGPLIMVYVLDAARRPVPGIEVVVSWETGQDNFYTGLKPEVDLGYADFSMAIDELYSVSLTLGDQPVTGFSTRACETEDGEQTFSSWEIIFVQP